ncbi:MAG TPA: hemerythrin domain-containing protein [Methylomirabilota bacterium]|jgi:hemerythrin superfamily protein|nr:hemerythrin domain-containing protein [Methylomirabilota bacterium]
MRATDLIAQDHRTVRDMFVELEALSSGDGQARQDLLDRIVDELEVHALMEEEIFYPAVREASRRIDDAEAGHQHLRSVIGEVQGREPDSPEFIRGVRLIKQVVLAHVMEEEAGIFLDAERMGLDVLEDLGARMESRKQELKTSLLQRGKRAA